MKKYLSVLLIVLLSVFSFNMEVDAAQEMTCLYEKIGDYKFLLLKTKSGESSLYINKNDEGIVGDWKLNDVYKGISFEYSALSSKCPLYAVQKATTINNVFGNYIIFFNDESNDIKDYSIVHSLIKEQSTEKKAIRPYRYEFKITGDIMGDADVLFLNICNSSGDNGVTCTLKLDNGETRAKPDGGWYNLNQVDISKVEGFIVEEWTNSISILTNGLNSIMCGNENCLNYVKGNYCKNRTTDRMCKDLATGGITDFESITDTDSTGDDTADSSGDNTTDSSGDDNGEVYDSYVYPILLYGNVKTQGSFTFKILDGDKLDISYSHPNSIGNYSSITHTMIHPNNTVYFYSFGSDFSDFEKKFVEQAKKDLTKKPQLSFCLRSRKGNKFAWYTELGTCDSNIYDDFYSQTINPDGSVDDGRDEVLEGDSNEIAGFEIYETCTEFLSNNDAIKLRDTLKFIVQLSRVLIPIIVFVFSTLDFAKAVFSGEEQTKKVKTNFFMRIAIAVVIFLLPTLLHFLLAIANQIWPNISTDLCGIL